MKKVYTYDYPNNREVYKRLVNGDVQLIVKNSGKPLQYVYDVLQGKRNNRKIMCIAETLADINDKVKAMHEIAKQVDGKKRR